ncbi:hypothetical protein [Pyxidicoccus fallax]|uniref:hypothetical protein n=1 Tax=Pyxidicoccus fallax TaxID=394095 RepID=UPI001FEA99D1|nr:hypothetical protein [Pyxidicoccus fallax]
MSQDPDWPIRVAAFDALQRLVHQHGEVLPWNVINEGFTYQGERLLFANRPRGIFWPRQMRESALSIKTNVPREGRVARYDELHSDEGFLYRFEGTDIDGRDNRRLVRAMELDAPLGMLRRSPSCARAATPWKNDTSASARPADPSRPVDRATPPNGEATCPNG